MEKKRIAGFCGVFLLFAGLLFLAPVTDQGTVTIGLGEVSAAPTATTKIVVIQGWNPPESGADELFSISANAQTKTVEEDEVLDRLGVTVLLDDSYAASAADARDAIRFVVTITNPAAGTAYSRTVDYTHASTYSGNFNAIDSGDYWTIYCTWDIDDALYDNIILTAGNWTLSVNYEIYA